MIVYPQRVGVSRHTDPESKNDVKLIATYHDGPAPQAYIEINLTQKQAREVALQILASETRVLKLGELVDLQSEIYERVDKLIEKEKVGWGYHP